MPNALAPTAAAAALPPPESSARRARRVLAILLALLALPLALIGPALLPGRAFLPLLPSALEPLASEDPAAAARALERANYLTSDRIFPCLTDQLEIRAQFLRGELPLWEPKLGLGLPLFATAITGTLYPPNWLSLLVAPERAAGPLAVLTLFLAGLGTLLFLERNGRSRAAALLGALAVQAGGFAASNLHYPMKLDAALWLPWSLWAIDGLALRKRGAGLALQASIALSLLAGFPPIAIFSGCAAALYALVRLGPLARVFGLARRGSARGRLIGALVFGALGVLTAAVQLAPTFEASLASLRQARSASDVYAERLPLSSNLGLAVPDLFGAPDEAIFAPGLPAAWWFTTADEADQAQGANPLEWNTYCGALVLLLALVGACCGGRAALFPALIALLALGFAQGWPLVRVLHALPGLNLGAPARVACLTWIALPWLAALGTDALLAGRRAALALALVLALVLLGCALVGWTALEPHSFVAARELELAARHGLSLEDVRGVVPTAHAERAALRLRASLALTLAAALALAGWCVLRLALGARDERARPASGRSARAFGTALGWAAPPLALALLAGAAALPSAAPAQPIAPALLALGAVLLACSLRVAWFAALPLALLLALEGQRAGAAHLVPRVVPETGRSLFTPSEAIAAIREAVGDGRVLRLDEGEQGAADVLALARPNMLQAYGLSDLSAYVAFTPRGYVELMQSMDPRTRWRSGIARLPSAELLDHPVLDAVRASCILSRAPLQHARLEPVLERPGFCVYRRTGVPPIASLHAELDAHSPPLEWSTGELRTRRVGPARLEFELEGSPGGWLIVREQHAAGWRARLDGRAAPTELVAGALRAYRVPAGDCRLETWYAPGSVRGGALVSLLALALGAFAWSRRAAWLA